MLKTSDYQLLETFYRSILRRIQHLPESTATPAIYLLLGTIPLEGQIHIKMLTFFCSIIRRPNSLEYNVICRQLAIKDLGSNSWVSQIRLILAKYNLPSAYSLVRSKPCKLKWKNQVNTAVSEIWMEELKSKAREMKTLEYLDTAKCTSGSIHSVWLHNSDPLAAHMATIKARIIVQRYPLGYSYYAGAGKQTKCVLCSETEETIEHFLLRCPAMENVRGKCIQKIFKYLGENNVQDIEEGSDLLRFILMTSSTISDKLLPRCEELTRQLVYSLHCKRAGLLGSTVCYGGAFGKGP